MTLLSRNLRFLVVLVFVHIQGFDEYMHLVLDDAEEINVKNTRKSLG